MGANNKFEKSIEQTPSNSPKSSRKANLHRPERKRPSFKIRRKLKPTRKHRRTLSQENSEPLKIDLNKENNIRPYRYYDKIVPELDGILRDAQDDALRAVRNHNRDFDGSALAYNYDNDPIDDYEFEGDDKYEIRRMDQENTAVAESPELPKTFWQKVKSFAAKHIPLVCRMYLQHDKKIEALMATYLHVTAIAAHRAIKKYCGKYKEVQGEEQASGETNKKPQGRISKIIGWINRKLKSWIGIPEEPEHPEQAAIDGDGGGDASDPMEKVQEEMSKGLVFYPQKLNLVLFPPAKENVDKLLEEVPEELSVSAEDLKDHLWNDVNNIAHDKEGNPVFPGEDAPEEEPTEEEPLEEETTEEQSSSNPLVIVLDEHSTEGTKRKREGKKRKRDNEEDCHDGNPTESADQALKNLGKYDKTVEDSRGELRTDPKTHVTAKPFVFESKTDSTTASPYKEVDKPCGNPDLANAIGHNDNQDTSLEYASHHMTAILTSLFLSFLLTLCVVGFLYFKRRKPKQDAPDYASEGRRTRSPTPSGFDGSRKGTATSSRAGTMRVSVGYEDETEMDEESSREPREKGSKKSHRKMSKEDSKNKSLFAKKSKRRTDDESDPQGVRETGTWVSNK